MCEKGNFADLSAREREPELEKMRVCWTARLLSRARFGINSALILKGESDFRQFRGVEDLLRNGISLMYNAQYGNGISFEL